MNAYLLFATIYLGAAATPGVDTMTLLSRTLASGWRAAVPYSVGIASAKMIMVAVSYFGLTALMAASPQVFFALKVIGALVLFWRAYKSWNAGVAKAANLRSEGFWPSLSAAFAIGASNPTALMFYMAVVPQVSRETSVFGLAGIVILGFGLVSVFYIGLAQQIRGWISRGENQRLVNRIVAGIFVLLAVVVLAR
jgi:threonine/homoserine/homoserine lactone efflux protein